MGNSRAKCYDSVVAGTRLENFHKFFTTGAHRTKRQPFKRFIVIFPADTSYSLLLLCAFMLHVNGCWRDMATSAYSICYTALV